MPSITLLIRGSERRMGFIPERLMISDVSVRPRGFLVFGGGLQLIDLIF